MTDNLEFIEIYPKVNVYRNTFDDVEGFLAQAQKEEGWEKWYTFGQMLPLQESPLEFDKFPTREEYIAARGWQPSSQSNLTQQVGEIFYDVTSHYLKMNPELHLLNYHKGSASINIYKNEEGLSENYSMNYHTDFVVPLRDAPGKKFGITTTFYLNDDYEDGEICFKINDHFISHKPKAGDVIVFPSADPYYHAVRKSKGNNRYMIRCFWQWDFPGTPEWLAGEQEHGKELWEEMERERFRKEIEATQQQAEDVHEFFGKDNGKY
jgi:hypothetical protein